MRLRAARPSSGLVALAALVVAALAGLGAPRPVGAAAVAVLLGVAGRGLLGDAGRRLPWAARSGVAVGTGFALAAVLLLVVADLDVFGPVAVAAIGLVLVLVGRGRVRGSGRRVGVLPLVLLALVGAGAATIPAYAFDLGGRDAGFYVLASEHLRSDGGLVLQLDGDVQTAMRRFAPSVVGATDELPLPGFFVRSSDGGVTRSVVPHGYHLVAAAMAGGATVTGGAGQWVVTFAGAVLVLLAAGLAAHLVPRRSRAVATAVGGVLLAANAALVYFSRYPMTEVPSGVVLLTAGLGAAAAMRGGGVRAAALAGAVLGVAPLVRPDAWPLLVVAPLVAVLLAARDRRTARAFAAGLAPVVVLAAVRALVASAGYTDETIGYVLGGLSPTFVVVALAVVAIGGSAVVGLLPGRWVAVGVRSVLRGVEARVVRRVLAAAVAVGTLVLVVHPPSLGLEIFREYATRPGVALAGAAVVALLLGPSAGRRRLVPLVPLLALAALALALVARNPQVLVPDQYWTARRYLPLALPVTAALAGAAVGLAWTVRRRAPWGRAAAVALPLVAVLAVGGSLSDARQALTTTEFDGVPRQLDRVDALLTGHDPLVLMGPSFTAWGMIGPSLALRSDRAVLMLGTGRVQGDPRSATLDDPAFSTWLGDVARRRPVYLVTANVSPLGLVTNAKDVRPSTVGTVDFSVLQIDHRVGAPPVSSATQTDVVTVYRLAPTGSGTG